MTHPVAGWYDDPADPEQLRWWTGSAWSDFREQRVAGPDAARPDASKPDEAGPGTTEPEWASAVLPLPYGPAALTGTPAVPPFAASGAPPVPPFAGAGQSGRPVPVAGAVAGPTAPTAPTGSKFARVRRDNALAFTGVIVGLVALLFNPVGGLSLLTLIFGVLGMVRSRELARQGAAVTGEGWAITALLLAIFTTVQVLTR